jgi:hypothetical protein
MSLAGKIRTTAIGLLRSLYGLKPGVTASGSTGSTVTGAVQVNRASDGTPTILLNTIDGDVRLANNTGNGYGFWATNLTVLQVGIGHVTEDVLRVIGSGGAGSELGWLQQVGRVRVTVDATNATITPATTGLSVAVKAGRHYSFKLVLFVEETTAADGLRVDFDGGTATMTAFVQNGIVTDTAGVRSLPQTTALATDVTDATTTGAAMAVFEGFFTVNAAGTFIPRFAKEADAAGANLTLRRGSHLILEDVV